ncbi:creatininase family protein [Lichenibacterium ramalinae]|uniref:Creatininase family protein n=1 Tax=Lichenibacterium ramalinae TaxID=2316527 RepID=A0A4Q2R832_9HYPH|nr:creatininase family protein [Lichenibacterium ramalinae]RYB01903.1 creatininase family protein [Lichenibacterium ramalinae]
MAFRTKFWAEMTWTDFREADMASAIAVLPVAAIEQHGPHLPVGVDTFIMEGYLAAAVARLPDDLPALVLPVQAVAKSNEHLAFPGTLTFSAETVIRAWREIGESVHRAGVRKLVIVNSHGGNIPPLDIVARELRVRLGMLVVVASWSRFGYPAGLYGPGEAVHGIHGGEAETSLMLAFRPELVRREAVRNFVPNSVAIAEEFTWLRVTQPVGFGWMAQDNSAEGAMGDAASATAEKGVATADNGAAAFIALLRDVQRFDVARLAQGPLAPEP